MDASRAVRDVLNLLRDPEPDGNGGYYAFCPVHNDGAKRGRRSLHISAGNNGTVLLHCFAGCHYEDIVRALGLKKARGSGAAREMVYRYTDAGGNVLYEVVRNDGPSGKTFKQRRPDGCGGFIWNTKGVERVPYRLPEVLQAVEEGRTVYVVEGEKCVEALGRIGLTVTCNDGGAGKWRSEHAKYFLGADVVILPDNDEPGKAHAEAVGQSLQGIARRIRIVDLPGLPPKGDIADWLADGHTKEELENIVEAADDWNGRTTNGDSSDGKLELIPLSDLLQEPEEAVSWTVDGLLPSSGFSVLAGKPKAGKSTLARELALRVARGEPFLGRSTDRGPVIYLALEEKRAEVRRHFEDMGADGSEKIYIFAATAPVNAFERIRRSVEEIKPALLIVDPLFRLARVKDANDYAQTSQALEPLLKLARETGTHVLVIHHMRKAAPIGADAILGSAGILGSVDTALLLQRNPKNRTLASIQRYGKDLPETVLIFDPETRTTTLGWTKEEQVLEEIKKEILAFLDSQIEWVGEGTIDQEVEGKTGPKRRALRELVKEGTVLRQGEGKKKSPFKYASKNSCFLVPEYTGEQENENLKNDVSAEPDNGNSCSQENWKIETEVKTREQEFLPSGEANSYLWETEL